MNIKRDYYCISDKNNKPDFRYLFEDAKDARKKIKQIKGTLQGETLFHGKNGRDFFVDGVRREHINPNQYVSIKKGCWSPLKVKKLELLDTIEPQQIFQTVVKKQEHIYSYSKNNELELSLQNQNIQLPLISNPFAGFDWQNSVIHTKAFVWSLAILCIMTISSVLYINASATKTITAELLEAQAQATKKTVEIQAQALSNKDEKLAAQFNDDMNKFVLNAMQSFDTLKQEDFEKEIYNLVAGSPMEEMAPLIAKQDRTVAAFLIGIAKKESNFGRRVPVLNGQNCFNYWGYRGIRARMGTGGHTCFNNAEDAINTVGGRIKNLVTANVDTPQEMVIWKCGSACAQDSQASKWIQDVSTYFRKLEQPDDNA